MRIALFCPSRGRPEAAHGLLGSFLDTKRETETEIRFCIDSDDSTKDDYPQGWLLVGEPTGNPTGPLNHWALQSDADIVGFIGDDSRFETHAWDSQVIAAIKRLGPGFVWADDGHKIPWPSTCFVSRKIIQSLGYFALPTLQRGFFDAVWIHLAGGDFSGKWNNGSWLFGPDNLARVLKDVMIRHDNSASVGTVPDAVIEQDRQTYNVWRETQMPIDRRKARAAALLSRFFD